MARAHLDGSRRTALRLPSWPWGPRAALLARIGGIGLGLSSVLRVVLFLRFGDGAGSAGALLACLGLGLGLDLLTALVLLLPCATLLALAPAGWLDRRRLRAPLLAAFLAGLVFLAFVEFFFFEEFLSRFNNVALDYLIFPTEVFTSLSESYDVPLFVALAVLAGAALAVLLERGAGQGPFERMRLRAKLRALGAIALGSGAALFLLWILPWKVRADRVENETAHNGFLGLVHAYSSGSLDYHAYYLSLPEPEAAARESAMLGAPPVRAGDAPQRDFVALSSGHPVRQVIVILEESLGSEFVGALGRSSEALTPRFDGWAREGLLLTELVSTGNRTVRGMEGTLASFVPLPGDAILHRDRSENVATLARVFREQGYRTAFFYGGRLLFDSMESFLEHNGWEELHERPDFPAEAFSTAWGAADEFVFQALLERQEAARASGQALFATLLTVSNHRPYDVPEEDTHVREVRAGRRRAVAYADFALGTYLDRARDAGLLEESVVLIVGDHGARVYGSSEIPVASYRVPALFLSPDPRWRGRTLERLCSQIDLAPTLLSLAGISCRAPFFGQDLLQLPAEGGRAFVHHNRDVGLLTDTTLVVLGLQKSASFHVRSGKDSDAFRALPEQEVTATQRALALDAAAVFQTAEELYESRSYHLPVAGAGATGLGVGLH